MNTLNEANHSGSEKEEKLTREIEREEKEIHQVEEVLRDEREELKQLEEELEDERHNRQEREALHIFVNGIKYTRADGVKEEMTGAEIVQLAKMEPANTDLTKEKSDVLIPMDEHLKICDGERFEAIRKVVKAG